MKSLVDRPLHGTEKSSVSWLLSVVVCCQAGTAFLLVLCSPGPSVLRAAILLLGHPSLYWRYALASGLSQSLFMLNFSPWIPFCLRLFKDSFPYTPWLSNQVSRFLYHAKMFVWSQLDSWPPLFVCCQPWFYVCPTYCKDSACTDLGLPMNFSKICYISVWWSIWLAYW